MINIGGTRGRGGIFGIVGLILLRRIDTRCIIFTKIYVEYGVRKPQLCAWMVDNNII